MRRRSKRAPNLSESTGKIGQEIPANQPAPLVPSYLDQPPMTRQAPPPQENRRSSPDDRREGRSESRADSRNQEQRPSSASRAPRPQMPEYNPSTAAGKLELETQPEMPSVPPPDPQAQAPKGYVVLTIGLPGSGKTTWFRRRGVTPLSSDLLRNILFDDVEEQRYQGLVFSTLRSLLRARLIAKMPWNYVDATNLSAHERRQWIKMAKSFGYDVQAVFFDVPLEVCLERNRSRDRMVAEEVMRKMAEKLKPPVFEEGFSKITVVRVKSAG
ncbi:ATP-binding protein [Occallatibacter riparius]|uniref:ATP-binding protein n=1 Tax=Occallatibacter riparius TaxID=1002689 RepID=A0A9J7BIC0_9BACT|nr:ATP-binding protein [Occallatibacter riparius]UWZ82684.1 ATP-binding protein [Occallatibacter riparius]